MPLTSHSILVGLDTAEGDVRYVRRFVGVVLTADTYLGDNAAGIGTEVVLANPNGPVMGGLGSATHRSLLFAGQYGRFRDVAGVVRAGNSANISLNHANGSLAAPTGSLSGDFLGQLSTSGYTGDTSELIQVGRIRLRALANVTSTETYGEWLVDVGRAGVVTKVNVMRLRSGGANIAEWLSDQATLRIIGGATLTGFRDSANSVYLDQWTDVGVRRIIGPIVIGSVAADPAASALVEFISTTRGILFPRMTQVERDAIAVPASGLVIYNTTTGKLNLRGAVAWEAITSV